MAITGNKIITIHESFSNKIQTEMQKISFISSILVIYET